MYIIGTNKLNGHDKYEIYKYNMVCPAEKDWGQNGKYSQ